MDVLLAEDAIRRLSTACSRALSSSKSALEWSVELEDEIYHLAWTCVGSGSSTIDKAVIDAMPYEQSLCNVEVTRAYVTLVAHIATAIEASCADTVWWKEVNDRISQRRQRADTSALKPARFIDHYKPAVGGWKLLVDNTAADPEAAAAVCASIRIQEAYGEAGMKAVAAAAAAASQDVLGFNTYAGLDSLAAGSDASANAAATLLSTPVRGGRGGRGGRGRGSASVAPSTRGRPAKGRAGKAGRPSFGRAAVSFASPGEEVAASPAATTQPVAGGGAGGGSTALDTSSAFTLFPGLSDMLPATVPATPVQPAAQPAPLFLSTYATPATSAGSLFAAAAREAAASQASQRYAQPVSASTASSQGAGGQAGGGGGGGAAGNDAWADDGYGSHDGLIMADDDAGDVLGSLDYQDADEGADDADEDYLML